VQQIPEAAHICYHIDSTKGNNYLDNHPLSPEIGRPAHPVRLRCPRRQRLHL